MSLLQAGRMRHRIRIDRPVADDSFDGAGSGSWSPVATVWAELQDALPSRGERLADGINVAARPARVRIYWRSGITPDMRMVRLRKQAGIWVDDRVMQIVAGPAELGNREGLEFMVEDYSSAGNPA